MTYLYETIPINTGDPVKHYELQQARDDLPLTRHPETGEAIRRVILGGWGKIALKPVGPKNSESDCGCGPGGCS